jgi:hypothetical protein
MDISSQLLERLRTKISGEIDLERQGPNRYILYTPFAFPDGDHYVLTLSQKNGMWALSDEGHTLMHLSYGNVDIQQGSRAVLIEDYVGGFGVSNNEGELTLEASEDDLADAVFSFVQMITKISAVTDWTRERVRSTFMDDFRALLASYVPEERLQFNYADPELDPDGNYRVDCRITADKPWHAYGVTSDVKCKDATISILHYERAQRRFGSFAIYEDQTKVGRRAVAQLSDVIGKQFSSLGDKDRIQRFIKEDVLKEVV